MDYSRYGMKCYARKLKAPWKKLVSKAWIIAFRLLLVGVAGVAVCVVMAGFGAVNALLDTAPQVKIDALTPLGYSSTSYYSDGTVAQVFAGAQANRVPVTIDQIPEMVQHTFVALEDTRFYEHSGIDIRGIMRAGFSVFREGGLNYGGSTITQQLLKNQIFSGGNEDNNLDKIIRKVQEMFLAIKLEDNMTKDEILEDYLNFVNLGNGAYGIQAAANTYFDKDVKELTLSEAAVIAPIAYSPTLRNPVNYPEENAERRMYCLEWMKKLGYCTQEEYDEAVADDVYPRIKEIADRKKASAITTFSYFTDELITQVTKDMVEELGYTTEYAQYMLYFGGIDIYTTQDRHIQSIVDKYYTDDSNFPEFGFSSSTGSCYELYPYNISVRHKDDTVTHYHRNDLLEYFKDYDDTQGYYYHEHGKKGINELFLNVEDMKAKIEEFRDHVVGEGDTYIEDMDIVKQPQSSFTVIEQATGEVKAVYGGRGPKTGLRTLNRATQSTRQVGSTFKVLASFLPAIDAAGLTLATVQDDSPFFYPLTTKEVYNWYNTGFRGLQTIRKGISSSLNIVAVRTLQQIGAPLGFEYLQKLGFSTLVKSKKMEDGTFYSDINLAIALGGLTNGVYNIELNAAYASIANKGVYNTPIMYTEVRDHDGYLLLSKKTKSSQVMKTSTAWLLTDAMEDTITNGTGSRLAFKDYKMHLAGKTGTASKNNDLWFVGYSPYYTAAVWTGFDHGFEQKNKSYQQDLWRNIMEEIHSSQQLPDKEFEMPDSIVKASICTKCGKLAVAGLCDQAEGGSTVATEYFAKGTVPTEKCTCHVRVEICKKSKKIARDDCPEKKRKSVVLLIKDENYEYPPEWEEILKEEYPLPITTNDSPYIYHPEELCDIHLPDGMMLDENGDLVPSDETDEETEEDDENVTDEEDEEDAEEPVNNNEETVNEDANGDVVADDVPIG
ncbi:MAG: transglycosylase domain-containing protein [Lachnospiraceae bacterium]|nr:transglycosylase domain-containing protein [Lachnospiraceae bacterium]